MQHLKLFIWILAVLVILNTVSATNFFWAAYDTGNATHTYDKGTLGNNLAYMGTNHPTITTIGKVNTAAYLFGASSYLKGTQMDAVCPQCSYSWDVWVNMKGCDSDVIWTNVLRDDKVDALTCEGNKIKYGYYNGTGWNGKTFETNITTNKWVHIAGTDSLGTVNLYVNGVAATVPKAPSITGATVNRAYYVGSKDTGVEKFFNGTMDELFFVDTVWTASQVSARYNATKNCGYIDQVTVLDNDISCTHLYISEQDYNTNGNDVTVSNYITVKGKTLTVKGSTMRLN